MIELKSEDVRLLAELGFAALSHGSNDEAATIFEGVRAARPDQEAGFIGGALADLACGKVDAAIKTLRSLPPTDKARLFLAMALHRSGDRGAARDFLDDVVATASDNADQTLAREMLSEFDDANGILLK